MIYVLHHGKNQKGLTRASVAKVTPNYFQVKMRVLLSATETADAASSAVSSSEGKAHAPALGSCAALVISMCSYSGQSGHTSCVPGFNSMRTQLSNYERRN